MKIVQLPAYGFAANCYLVYDENSKKGLLVDPGEHNQNSVNYIKNEGIDIEYIVLTHGHGDHIGGIPGFKKDFPKAKLVASILEKEFLMDPVMNESKDINGKELKIECDIYVDDCDSLKVEGTDIELKFISTPGHTPGGMCILLDKILFSGDTLFRESVGRTDLAGGSTMKLLKSIKEKLFVLADDIEVLPGHMEATSIGYEKKYNPFVH